MKIGVFGDSFAVKGYTNSFPSWINFLEEHYPTVDSYGIPGSPLFKSVEEFIANHCNYDKIVFVATNPFRYEINGQTRNFYINSPVSIDAYLEQVETFSEDWWMLRKCKEWLGYPNSGLDEIYQYSHKTMIDYVKDTRPDALLIPAFKNSFIEPVSLSLEEIQAKEVAQYQSKFLEKFEDNRICHLSTANNKLLSDYVRNRLQGNECDLALDNFKEISQEEFPRYFTRK